MKRIEGRAKDLGDGFTIRRVLPHALCRSIGPWVFLDHFGPLEAAPGTMAVRPHPHIGLATVTYLYDGAIVHRDSVGSHAVIRPGALNLMTAGRGIVHSERSEDYSGPFHGLQLWLALPEELQEMEPEFHHEPADQLPEWTDGPVTLRLLMGELGERVSGVPARSPTLFVDAAWSSAGAITLPREHDEVAVLPTSGFVVVNGEELAVGTLLVLEADAAVEIVATEPARVAIVGGTHLGKRHMYWNFVHSDPARIDAAKALWRDGGFPSVPSDDAEFIPLPD